MKVTIELTEDEIRAILTTAQEHAGYWCRVGGDLVTALEQPLDVFDAESLDRETGVYTTKLGTLTREGLLGAATVFANAVANKGLVAQLLAWPEALDAEGSDALLQCALFGEVRYG